MIDRIIAKLPEAWRGLAELIAGPIAWVPVLQQTMMNFFFEAQGGWIAATKYIFLLFPVFLGVVAVWSTTLALYTLPFRAGRRPLVSLLRLSPSSPCSWASSPSGPPRSPSIPCPSARDAHASSRWSSSRGGTPPC